MGQRRSWRPSPALVISVIALFVALGGSALAIQLGRNAVKTNNIKNGAVKTKKIAKEAVTGPKIANGAVTATKVADAVRRPRAYALVENGVLNEENSSGVLSVDFDVVNEKVCFDLAFDPVTAMAVTQRGFGATYPQVNVLDVAATCSAPHQDAVVFTTNNTGNPAVGGFFVWFE